MTFRVTTDVAVPVRDGVTLRADVWEPADAAPGPAILWRTPYLKEEALPCGFLDPRVALARGYRIVVQDVRGMGTSGGAFEAFVHEGADGADTIAWIAEQPWSDGDVVMAGYSYVGIVQWLAAAERPPALRAIAPSISADRAHEGWTFTSGVVEHALATSWLAAALLAPEERWLDGVERAFDHVDELLERAPWARGWFTTPPDDTAYWGARSADHRREAIDVPVLSIGGWFDVLLAGTLAGHAASRTPHDRLVVGPWAHEVEAQHLVGDWNVGVAGTGAAFGLTARMCDFFDAARAGRAPDLAPATVYVLGDGRWRTFDAWPPPGAETVAAPARGSGAFAVDPAAPTPAVAGRALRLWCVDWGYGPRDHRAHAARDDVLTLPVELDGGVLLAGPAAAELEVEPDGAAVTRDWVATLCVERAGGLFNVAEGIARRPGAETTVTVTLGDLCLRLGAEERLVLLVAGAAFPRWAPGPASGPQLLRGASVHLTVTA